jgi:hypothetical protein
MPDFSFLLSVLRCFLNAPITLRRTSKPERYPDSIEHGASVEQRLKRCEVSLRALQLLRYACINRGRDSDVSEHLRTRH